MNPRVVAVTPEIARIWLKQVNPKFNRKLKDDLVARYAADMLAGRWQQNGESLVFNAAGNLLDGQHRLHAIVKSGVTIKTVVVRDVADAAIDTIDSSPCRQAGETLGMKGEPHARVLASALSHLWRYEASGHPYGGRGPTRKEIFDLLERQPKVRESVALAVAHDRRLVPASVAAFVHAVFAKADRRDEVEATRFVTLLAQGEGLESTSPVFLLRDRLIANLASNRKLDRRDVVALLFRAWNAFRTGETPRRLALPRTVEGATPKLPDAA